MLCGLLKADAGRARCLGLDFRTQAEAIKRQVGYMTQRFSFWEDLSIRENLDFVAPRLELPAGRGEVTRPSTGLGLTKRQNQLAGQLSGGWKQRLALAACMLHEPRLLSARRADGRRRPQGAARFLGRDPRLSDQGLTVLVSTHYMDEAERCDRIVYILNGKLVAPGHGRGSHRAVWPDHLRGQGEDVRRLADALKGAPGVEHVAFFGALLHVSGHDRAGAGKRPGALSRTGRRPHQRDAPSLEDVFIHLQGQARMSERFSSRRICAS